MDIPSIPLFGSLVNGAAVVAGSLVGLGLRSRIPDGLMKLPFQSMGLFVISLGLSMAMKSQNVLVLIVSIALGTVIGGLLDLDGAMARGSQALERRFSRSGSNLANGFMTASLLFCVGSLAVLGAFEEGLGGPPRLLLTKALMDGLASVALSASMGLGVLFSAGAVLVYQGTLTLAAGLLQPLMTEPAVVEMSAAGGLMLIALGLDMAGALKERIKVTDALPALAVAVVLARLLL